MRGGTVSKKPKSLGGGVVDTGIDVDVKLRLAFRHRCQKSRQSQSKTAENRPFLPPCIESVHAETIFRHFPTVVNFETNFFFKIIWRAFLGCVFGGGLPICMRSSMGRDQSALGNKIPDPSSAGSKQEAETRTKNEQSALGIFSIRR